MSSTLRSSRSALDWANQYIDHGLAPIPVPFREKGAKLPQWQNLRVTKANVTDYFNGDPQNIGVLLGAPSGNLVDIDLDCIEAVVLAPKFLPDTQSIFGRASRRRSHWLYRTENAAATTKFKDPTDGSMLVEIRSTGHQTVFPGSEHPSEERITFDETGEPGRVERAALHTDVSHLAAAALLARHWAEGQRHETAMALSGALLYARWDPDEAEEFVKAVAEAGGDDERRVTEFQTTLKKIEDDAPATGLPKLEEIMGEPVVSKVAEWLGLGRAAKDTTIIEPEIAELNEKHAVIMIGGKTRIMNFTHNPNLDEPELTFSSFTDFSGRYANRTIRVGKETIPLASYWFGHERRREYLGGLAFDPTGRASENFYNLWQGFAVEPRAGDCSLYLDHVREVIASGDQEIADYILAWMANAVQQPGRKPGTSIVLRGKQGTGKGMFVQHFGKLFGHHFVHITQQRHLTGHFNALLKDALVLFADEAFWAGDKQGEGALKGLVTEETIPIEFKGIDPIRVRNHIRLLVASNADWVVPAGLEERRFFVVDVSEARMQDHTYFGAMVDQMENGGREALLDFLMKYDLDGVNLNVFPKTEALREQKVQSLSPLKKWWNDCLMQGYFAHDTQRGGANTQAGDPLDWEEPVPIKQVHQEYLDHAKALGYKVRQDKATFGIEMAKLTPGRKRPKLRIDGVRHECYRMPPLEECRRVFNQLMMTPGYKWPDVEGDYEDHVRGGDGSDF